MKSWKKSKKSKESLSGINISFESAFQWIIFVVTEKACQRKTEIQL